MALSFLPLGYIILITTAEVVTSYYQVVAGFSFHGAILFTLLAHAAFSHSSDKNKSHLLMSIALAPLVRILSLSAPLIHFSYIQWFALLSIPMLLAILVLISFQHLRRQDIGLVVKWRQLPLQFAICLSGIPFGYIEYLILRPQPLVEDLSLKTLAAPILIMFICTGFTEELAFRGIIQHNAVKYLNTGLGLFYVSLLFAVMHIGNLSLLHVVFVFGIAYFYAYSVKSTSSIIGASISHGLTNVLLFLIIPLVS